jgi:hypothetical protein
VNWNLGGQLLTATGCDYEFGILGILKLGDLAILATDAGSVALIQGKVALADLSMASAEGGDLVLLPEPGSALGLFSESSDSLLSSSSVLFGITRFRPPRHN